MKQTIFEYAEIEGFRSIVKYLKFDLIRPGLNLIKGVNGAGKTTMFEAIVWCLFGINLKETTAGMVASWPEVRPSVWNGTRVSVKFKTPMIGSREPGETVYTITRHLDYKGKTYDVKGEDSLMIAIGDDDRGQPVVLVGDARDKKAQQERINEILGIDAKTFMNSIMFGQRMAKLVTQDNDDKRKLFETLFDVEWVAELKKKVDQDLVKFNAALLVVDADIRFYTNQIEMLKNQKQQAQTMLAGFEEGRFNRVLAKQEYLSEYTGHLNNITITLDQLNKSFEAIKYDPAGHDEVEDRHGKLCVELDDLKLVQAKAIGEVNLAKNKVEQLDKQVKSLESDLTKLESKSIDVTCPYCEQELKPGNKLEKNHNIDLQLIKDKLKVAKGELAKAKKAVPKDPKPADNKALEVKIGEAEQELGVFDELFNQREGISNKIIIQNGFLTQVKKDILRVNNEIDAIKAEIPPVVDIPSIETHLKDAEKALAESTEISQKIKKEIEVAEWWSKKGFSAGGIKAFIFKAMLSQLNQNIKKYGQRVGVSLEFSIDLNKTSKPFTTVCSIGNKLNKDYKEFSGGEKQRLDIVLIFAMYDLISMNANMNILVMDEVFEGLDEAGEAVAFDLIREKAMSGKSVYVISHSSNLDSLYTNTLHFGNENDNTHLIN